MLRSHFRIRKSIRGQPKMKSYKMVIAPEFCPRALKAFRGTTAKWQPVVDAISIFANVCWEESWIGTGFSLIRKNNRNKTKEWKKPCE